MSKIHNVTSKLPLLSAVLSATSLCFVVFFFFYWFVVITAQAKPIKDDCNKKAREIVGEEWAKILEPTAQERAHHPSITGMPWGGREYRACIYKVRETIKNPLLRAELVDTL